MDTNLVQSNEAEKLKLYPYGLCQTQPPQEGSNRNLAKSRFLGLVVVMSVTKCD